ncbi:Acyl-CoA Delta(11) desaturase [Harpegnathos saltator]|uniref:Acyl-CoA Delta(11) desaturase n=1 Tax=Harpegnathos saltator TaxID=610380 RepID=E2C647_HARSA|nr:Acyl-CoA Delta(11) desaturase [Harpegnathos saltator]
MTSNIIRVPAEMLFEEETVAEQQSIETMKEQPKYVIHIIWRYVMLFLYLHIASLYGIYLAFTSAKLVTVIFAGAHRLWSHRSYKAKWPLRLLLVILNTTAFQNSVIDWAKDHRIHHKYSDTDADPHNSNRGFFFSHMGWLLCRKHPEVMKKGKAIDISDLKSDPMLVFQKKYYALLMPLMCFILPTVIPVVCWNETWTNAYYICAVFRYIFLLNMTGLVNSAAHSIGNKPYDKYIKASQNKSVAIMISGEGWHNYHHVFPWDYKTAEYGNYSFNITTAFIDFFAKIGWAYDLKSTSEDMVRKRVEKTGDGSHDLWGWGDNDQTQEERNQMIVTYNSAKD